jgi:hypothetical protein
LMILNYDKFKTNFAFSFTQAKKRLESNKDNFILSVNHDWYERVSTDELMMMQRNSTVVLDLYGCGLKCFRNVECTSNSLSFKQDPSALIFTYPWVDGDNCVVLPNKDNTTDLDLDASIDILLSYRHENRGKLYEMYLNSIKTNHLYAPKNYVPSHIMKNIIESL